jgi:hypothetical protein
LSAPLIPSPKTALAQSLPSGSYACILTDTFFFSTPDDSRGLFLIPKTYYVKILEYGETHCKIEYLYDDANTKKLVGYVETNKLTAVDYTPKRPYLYYVFDVSYRIDNTQINDSSFLNQITVTCAYYGDYIIGSETYCYVLRGDTFGYIPKPASLTITPNTEYDEYLASLLPDEPLVSDEPIGQTQSSPAQIAILITLCLLIPILAALIIKPPKRPAYETDELYES